MVEGGGNAGDIAVFAVVVGPPHGGVSRGGGGGIAVEGCYHNLVYCQRLLVFVAFWQPWLTSGVGSDEYRGECQCDGCKYGAGVCHGEVIV